VAEREGKESQGRKGRSEEGRARRGKGEKDEGTGENREDTASSPLALKSYFYCS